MKVILLLGLIPTVLCAGGLVGGLFQQTHPEGNADIRNAASFALTTLNGLLTSDPQMSKISIMSAKTQVVAGMNYYLKLKVQYGSDVKVCDVVVYSRPWDNVNELTKQTCINTNQNGAPPTVLGGIVPVDTDLESQKAIKFGIEELNARSNNMYRTLPIEISSVTKQLVSGFLYRFKAVMVNSECRNNNANANKGLEDCSVNNEMQQRKSCSFEVQYQAWLKTPYSLVNVSCLPPKEEKPVANGEHVILFQKFKETFQKIYDSPEEEKKRFHIFSDNMRRVKEYQDIERGTARYGPTIFADMTKEEFKQRLNPKPWNLSKRPANMLDADIPPLEGTPSSFDWRDHGAVTEVKNQGSCGSCWAFSTTGNIEGQWAIKRRHLISLSEQELVDCDKVDQGCNGGLPSQAYEAVMKLGGLENEKDYGYKGVNEKCFFNKSEVVVKINGSVKISENETEIAAWLAKNGPISIGINAFAMQFYMGGIAHPWKIFCNPSNLDHGVLIVGYGVEGDKPYWIIKNSWGPSWGEEGYYYVYRGAGVCGLNKMCTSSTVL